MPLSNETTKKPLSAWEWVTTPATTLRKAKWDVNDRLHYCGHPVVLGQKFTQSIGCWGRMELDEMINVAEPKEGLLLLSASKLYQFRYRHGLMHRKNFEAIHGKLEGRDWLMPEVCWEAHYRIQTTAAKKGAAAMSLGQAASMLAFAGTQNATPVGRCLGLLPVEIVLYARAFEMMQLEYGVDYTEWEEFDDATKREYWTNVDEDLSLERIASLPAWRSLPSLGLTLRATG